MHIPGLVCCYGSAVSGDTAHLPALHEAFKKNKDLQAQEIGRTLRILADPSSLPSCDKLKSSPWPVLIQVCAGIGAIPHKDSMNHC